MRIVALSLIVLFACMPLWAAEQLHGVFGVDQPAVDRHIEGTVDGTLNQPPDLAGYVYSDVGDSLQVVAENFTVITGGLGYELWQIVVWGVYGPGNVPVATDSFDVLVHSDSGGGLPGPVLCSETGLVPTSRLDTGVDFQGVDEYIYTLDLAVPCNLADGTYWIEIFNNTGPGTDDWAWETGTFDPVNGVIGMSVAWEAPGVTWTFFSSPDLAIQLNGTVVPVELQSFSVE